MMGEKIAEVFFVLNMWGRPRFNTSPPVSCLQELKPYNTCLLHFSPPLFSRLFPLTETEACVGISSTAEVWFLSSFSIKTNTTIS